MVGFGKAGRCSQRLLLPIHTIGVVSDPIGCGNTIYPYLSIQDLSLVKTTPMSAYRGTSIILIEEYPEVSFPSHLNQPEWA